MKKKLMLLLSLVLCMIFVVGCSKGKEEKAALSADEKKALETNMTQNFDSWVNFDFKSIYENTQYDKETRAQYKQWGELRDKLGKLKDKSEPVLSEAVYDAETEKNYYTGTIEAQFEKGKLKFSIEFDAEGNLKPESTLNVQEIESTKQILSKALLNTLMGMGTVFVILILISLVISCFGLIGKSQAKKAEAAKAAAPTAPTSAVMAPVVQKSEDVTDDLELVAVITAAIMASMGEEAPAEGLVVRSIKKRNASKWKNA